MKITDLPNNDPTWVVPAGDYADQRQRAELVALRARLATAEADVARLNGMRCETCKYQGESWPDHPCDMVWWCSRHDARSATFMGGCLAWEKRDEG